MSTQPPNRLEELEKAFAIFKQSSEAFERKYRAFEQDLRASIDGLNHFVTMTFGIVQTQEIDIREIKSILNEHTLALAQMQEVDIKEIKSTLSEHTSILNEYVSVLNKHGRMLERILSLLEPKS
jgi:hypothetical protein